MASASGILHTNRHKRAARVLGAGLALGACLWATTASAQSEPSVGGDRVESSLAEPTLESADSTRWSARARWGLEYDDNPYRLEGYDESGDALTRYLVGADIVTDLAPSGQVSATLRHGGTLFRREADASAILTEASGAGSWRLHRRVGVQALVDIKDRTERESQRDYNRGGVGLRINGSLGPLRVWAGPSLRYFAFKPSPTSSNSGPSLQTGIRWMIRNDLAADGSYSRTWRNYSSPAWQVENGAFVPYSDGRKRSDQYDAVQVSLRYQRAISARVGYQYGRNRSNSFGQGLRRHGLDASVTVPLFWEVFLSARAEVQRTRYQDRVLIDEFFFIDEDNRNNLAAALARPIGDGWEVEVRYNFFAQEFGTDGEYGRQTLGLAIGYYLDSR